MKNYDNQDVRIIRDENTKEPIGIQWNFDNGEKQTIYPKDRNEEWFVTMIADITRENSANRKQRKYVAASLDDADYEGDWFADKSILPMGEYLNIQEEEERVQAFADTLSEVNKKRFLLKYEDPSLSLQDIADMEGTSKTAIFKSFKSIQEKYFEFLANLG